MKKRTLLVVLIVIAVTVAIPVSVFAATSDTPAAKAVRCFFGIDASKLTEKQKADVNDYSQKMADLQKQFINQMVADGVLTKEQGDAELKKVDEALQASLANGTPFGAGLGPMKGMAGFKAGGPGMVGIDPSKLTAEQKTYLADASAKIVGYQKQIVAKYVEFGVLTKAQGDSINSKLDTMAQNTAAKDPMLGIVIGKPGMFGFNRIADTSKLSSQQKAEIESLVNSIAGVQKDAIAKLVADGVMTSEQGDAIQNRLDQQPVQPGTGQSPKMKGPRQGMGKGMGMGMGGWQGGSRPKSGTPQPSAGAASAL